MVCSVALDTTVVQVVRDGHQYHVEWDDGVANEWRESFEKLSDAIHLVSKLVVCYESGWEIGLSDLNKKGE